MKELKRFPGTTLKAAARRVDQSQSTKLAKQVLEKTPLCQNEKAIAELSEIIHNYYHQQNCDYIPNNEVRDWLNKLIENQQNTAKLIQEMPDMVIDFFQDSPEDISRKTSSTIGTAKKRLEELQREPTHLNGDFLVNHLIHELVKFRTTHGLSSSHTYNAYADTNDSFGTCVPWVQNIVNNLTGKTFSNQSITSRIRQIPRSNS